MFDDLSFVDDKDCMGDCDKCPYVDWVYANSFDDPYPTCKLERNYD